MIAADRDDGGVNYRAFLKNDQASRACAQIHQAYAELTFIGAEHGIGAGQGLEDGIVDMHASAVHRGNDILRSA